MPYGPYRDDIVKYIDSILREDGTPNWAKPLYLCVRDDHIVLQQLLRRLDRWTAPIAHIMTSVITALIIGAIMWLMTGQN